MSRTKRSSKCHANQLSSTCAAPSDSPLPIQASSWIAAATATPSMANIPPSLSHNPAAFGGGDAAPPPPPPPPPLSSSSSAAVGGAQPPAKDQRIASAEQLVLDLCDPKLRENALLDLSKKREIFQDLAPLLWNSYGTIASLLQEIVSIYSFLSPPTLTPVASNRVCNALALLQCVASHPDTRIHFLNVKVDDTEVISFLLQTEIIPLCLRTMEMGSELSKTVATFIVQKILLDEIGLQYVCATADRFYAVGQVLASMVTSLAEQPSARLLKHIVRCYLRLSEHPRACDSLKGCLPEMLKDGTFINCLRDDPATRKWLQQLLINVGGAPRQAKIQGGF